MPPGNAPKRLTHFLCIPLVTAASRPQLQKSLQAFASDVKNDQTPENPQGIPEKAIRPLGTLHLTLGVMSLLTPVRIEGALSLLQSLDISSLLAQLSPITGSVTSQPVPTTPAPTPAPAPTSAPAPVDLEITLRGLKSMHEPSRTSVLYSAPSDHTGRLHAFCNALRTAFAEFLVPDERPLLLHATLVNTVYVPSGKRSAAAGRRTRSGSNGRGHGGKGQERQKKMTIDARDVLERYAETVWMEGCRVEKVAVCRMGAIRVRDGEGRETGEEEYVVEGELGIPLALG